MVNYRVGLTVVTPSLPANSTWGKTWGKIPCTPGLPYDFISPGRSIVASDLQLRESPQCIRHYIWGTFGFSVYTYRGRAL